MTHCIECEGNSEVGHEATCYYAQNEVNVPCGKCGQHMADGSVVVMSWQNTAIEHVNCPEPDGEYEVRTRTANVQIPDTCVPEVIR